MPVRANKDIWILGDNYLTEAVAVLREIQNQNRDELYIYSDYDPQIYFPSLLSKDSFVSQIKSQLYTALEEHNKLPSVIIFVIGNDNVNQKVLNPECTRKIWNALFTEVQRTIRTRKEDLPRKCQISGEPRVYVANMFPRFRDHHEKLDGTQESFKTKRRRLNGILPQLANDYGYKVLPINGIIPENANIFVTSTGKLNGKGLREYWYNLSREVKIADVRIEEAKNSDIIQAYFEQQRENRRVAQERQRANNERLSLPRAVIPRRLDRGDGPHTIPRERSKSVPVRKLNKRRDKRF